MKPSKTDNRPLYSARGLYLYIKLIKRKYSYVNIGEILNYANMELHQLEDEGHSFTQEQIDRFYEKAVQLTGNKSLAREAGKYAASPDGLGLIRHYILGLVNPAQAYELIGKYAHNFVKSSIYESKKIRSNAVEITVTPNEGVNEKPYQCENRMGYWEAISLIFNYKLPSIEHPECMFEGGRSCRYIVTWQEAHSTFWKKIRNIITIFLFILVLTTAFLFPDTAIINVLAMSFSIIVLISLFITTLEKRELQSAIETLREGVDQLMGQINVNYNNALFINEISHALGKQINIDHILSDVIHILEKRLDYDRGIILLTNKQKTRLFLKTGFGYTFEQYNILKNVQFHLDKPESKGVFVVSFREQRPILVNDIIEIEDSLSPQSLEFARKIGTKSFICCPIVYKDEAIGILAVDNIKTKKPLRQSELNLLMGIANAIGLSINNAMLFEAKEAQFKSIIKTLAASIDARDFLTAGHSEKVTEYSVGICRELGLSKEYTEMIRVAALLHDYGKIGIDDTILKKDGLLSDEERDLIKTHAEKTQKILQQINFEGIYKEVPDIAAYHHEKINGSGYPKGLKGEEIPLGSKIIAVADFFEAVTSKRHYREAMRLDEAFNLLMEKSGIHYDTKVVNAFISYYNREYINQKK
jgi:putative nucleotidyltransferase with HDIG domain